MSCETTTIYSSIFESQTDISTISIILASVILPIQFIIFVVICYKGYKSLKVEKIYSANKKPQEQQDRNEEGNSENCCSEICSNGSKVKIIILAIIMTVFFLITFVMLVLTTLSVWQALTYTYDNGQCTLTSTVSSFVAGDDSWIGLDFMTANTTKLALDLNTRITVSKNAIKGLLLNGTVATVPPGIGFTNGTNIYNVSSQTNLSQNALIVTNSVESYIDGALRQWLYRNSSLSGDYSFPICQTSSVPLTHPVLTNSTIQLDYMDSICTNLTDEVNQLVANGRAVDTLLNQVSSVESKRSSVNENLTSYNASLSSISLRSNEYTENLSSMGVDVDIGKALPVVILLLYTILFILTIIYLCCQYVNSSKKRIIRKRIDISESESSPSERSISIKQKKIIKPPKLLSQNYSKALICCSLLTNIFVGLSGLYYAAALNFSLESCTSFESAMSSQTAFNDLSLTNSDLLQPVQQCTSGANNFFLQTSETTTQQQNLDQLYKISSLYNESIPLSLFNSHSLDQIQILKGYLLHLETMPVKSKDFAISNVLSTLNTYTNGSNSNSEQVNECSSAVLKDQYIFNSVNCDFTLIDYDTQDQITDPRCLQIPTYDGTSGTNETDLNQAQHTIVLNSSCPSITDFYDGSNKNCFLGKRLQLLDAAGCTTVSASYAERIANLVQFSVETGSYTDVYLQNLRNYFGVYAVMNSNLSEFFVGSNMSDTLDEFGSLSNNLLNKTSCSYVKSKMDSVYAAYCPTVNSIPSLFFDSFIWVTVVLGLSFFQMMIFYYLDYSTRKYFMIRIAELKILIKEQNEVKSSSKKLEQSQQTLRDEENRENPVVFGIVKDKSDDESSSKYETIQYNREYREDEPPTNKKRKQVDKRYQTANEHYEKTEEKQNFQSTDHKIKKRAFFEREEEQIRVQSIDVNKDSEETNQKPFFGNEIQVKEPDLKKKQRNVSSLSKRGEEDKRLKIIQLNEILDKRISMADGIQQEENKE